MNLSIYAARAANAALNAELLAQLALEYDCHIGEAKAEHKARRTVDYAPDPMGLRGIPATGRGVGGVIRGTQPEAALIARTT